MNHQKKIKVWKQIYCSPTIKKKDMYMSPHTESVYKAGVVILREERGRQLPEVQLQYARHSVNVGILQAHGSDLDVWGRWMCENSLLKAI